MQDGDVEGNRQVIIIARNEAPANDPRPTPMRYINRGPMPGFDRIGLKEQGGAGRNGQRYLNHPKCNPRGS